MNTTDVIRAGVGDMSLGTLRAMLLAMVDWVEELQGKLEEVKQEELRPGRE